MGKNQDPGTGINIPDPQHWLSMAAVLLGQSGPGDAAEADGADEGLRGGVLQH
jgi:hypothetical protein